jgi:hypothetical protein
MPQKKYIKIHNYLIVIVDYILKLLIDNVLYDDKSFNPLANVDDRFLITYFADASVRSTTNLKNWIELILATGQRW